MAKVKNFEKVLKVLTEAAPAVVSKEEITRQIGADIEPYRISTYIWEIKNKAGIPVQSVKEGRKVTGFSIPVALSDAPAEPEVVSGETAEEDESVVAAAIKA